MFCLVLQCSERFAEVRSGSLKLPDVRQILQGSGSLKFCIIAKNRMVSPTVAQFDYVEVRQGSQKFAKFREVSPRFSKFLQIKVPRFF